MKPLRIGILGLKCYDHLIGAEVPRYLGGIETQLATLAKGLVKGGCEVSVVTFDHGQAELEDIDGVEVIAGHDPQAGIRFIRSYHPRSTGMWQAMRRANADVWLQMGAGIETGQTAWFCRSAGKPFVFCMASDANFGPNLHAGFMGLEGRAYRFGLRRASSVIAQTRQQQLGLKQATGIDSTIIPMAIVPPAGKSEGDKAPHVLWVGRIMPSKRLEWLIEAAKRCPEIVFDIVGTPNHQSERAVALMKEAESIANVQVHGRAPSSELANLYAGATLLACTSELEGFPTTFLEAWSLGVPVVTTFDPDQVVAKNGLGKVTDSLDGFVTELKRMVEDDGERVACSQAAQAYFKENHSVEGVCRKFREMLEASCKPREVF